MLTLRQLVVKNGPASPFQQVLAWLAKQGDYFTAASVALDLLQDGETLYHLWKHLEMIDEQEEESKLDGLLDGIIPIRLVEHGDNMKNSTNVYVVHLADMTVGCLIKGGARMAKTLRKFLRKNEFYDPARACLMLAAATASAVSDDQEAVASVMGTRPNYNEKVDADALLWPVKCLLQIGIARNYLETALLLLNVTVPDELRHRRRAHQMQEEAPTPLIPGLEMTKRLVTMIVASDIMALDMLLDCVDSQSQLRYWQSLDHETQLSLSLIEIKSSFPIIRSPEIRAWVREELNMCLKKEADLPTSWLQELCIACMTNAGCDINDLEIDEHDEEVLQTSTLSGTSGSEIESLSATRMGRVGRGESISFDGSDEDGLNKVKLEMVETRNVLMPSTSDYSLDYDLLIPCLLLLECRRSPWFPNQQRQLKRHASTQSLLDAACYLAGRQPKKAPVLTTAKKEDTADEKPYLFADFDSTTAMRQCFLAQNVSAGANLIGGKNGFVLHICQVLMEEIGLSMADAESFLMSDELDLRPVEESKVEMTSFDLTNAHRKLLWLLDEHVLSVKTFGEFETIHIRGRVDPVFASRSIFRAWLSLSYGDKKAASNWLSQWLARRLEIGAFSCSININSSEPTPSHRLACAALARSLIWPSTSTTLVGPEEDSYGVVSLASVMEFETKFLIEVCESCVGLVESVPSGELEETSMM
mmetsp:Transcript_4177/g.7659  ORF Transcript_4177/g.7659 Transcript_4177/m.7659 type:complete len:702 (-) Transcript_4177:675-2780(-)